MKDCYNGCPKKSVIPDSSPAVAGRFRKAWSVVTVVIQPKPLTMYRTRQVIPGASLLLVDMEMQYFEPTRDNMSLLPDEQLYDAHLNLMVRVGRVYRSLLEAKQRGHRIYATHNHPLVHGFDELVDDHLPPWDHFEFQDDPNHLESFYANLARPLQGEKVVLVCGVWLERCVYRLTYQLRYHGIKAIMLDHPDFSLETKLIGDSYSVIERAKIEGLSLLEYPQDRRSGEGGH